MNSTVGGGADAGNQSSFSVKTELAGVQKKRGTALSPLTIPYRLPSIGIVRTFVTHFKGVPVQV